MSQTGGAWQTATSNRARNSQSSSRTPQNRSGTNSPSQQGQPNQPPAKNPWTQNRSNTPSGGVNGPTKGDVTPTVQEETHQPINGFNAADARAFLAKGVTGSSYKVADAGGAGSRPAWGAKPNTMANGQPFFTQLAKQVAATEGGG